MSSRLCLNKILRFKYVNINMSYDYKAGSYTQARFQDFSKGGQGLGTGIFPEKERAKQQ